MSTEDETLRVGDRDAQALLAQAYAFLGNSLMAPMSQTDDSGLDPAFWQSWPIGTEDDTVACALDKLASYAEAASAEDLDSAIQAVSVEYTHLFVGPPHPAAPPWETMNPEGHENTIGFGQATMDMKHLLGEAGLELGGPSNQYEDHLGVELLYLSTLCARAAQSGDANRALGEQRDFIQAHPLSWISRWRQRVEGDSPSGYYSGIAELAQCMLEWHVTRSEDVDGSVDFLDEE